MKSSKGNKLIKKRTSLWLNFLILIIIIIFIFIYFIFQSQSNYNPPSSTTTTTTSLPNSNSNSIHIPKNLKPSPTSKPSLPSTSKNIIKCDNNNHPREDKSCEPTQNIPNITPNRIKVAFAITITKDGKFQDGAAVLAHSIIRSFEKENIDISFVAFVHPNVTTSRPYLQAIGYSVIEAPTPINETAIRGKYLRNHINDKAGCCGAAELIKLYSYRLTNFDWVLHLDADVIVTKSFMELFYFNKSLIYTTDPNMASYKGDHQMPVQGGFLLIKPSLEDYDRIIAVLMEGDYRSGSAWGGTGIGWFWGGKTIQGVLAYYYNQLNPPERSLRVDRCIYNTMADTPECKVKSVQEVKSAHFTICQKPWNCDNGFANNLCGELHLKWRQECIATSHYYNLTSPNSCCNSRGHYVPLPLSNAIIPSNHRFSLNIYPQVQVKRLNPLPGAGFVEIDYKAKNRKRFRS